MVLRSVVHFDGSRDKNRCPVLRHWCSCKAKIEFTRKRSSVIERILSISASSVSGSSSTSARRRISRVNSHRKTCRFGAGRTRRSGGNGMTQGAHERVHRFVSPFRAFFQALQDDGIEFAGQGGSFAWTWSGFLQVFSYEFSWPRRFEWETSCEQPIKERSERIHVRARIDWGAQDVVPGP